MKLPFQLPVLPQTATRSPRGGFTLPEVMIAMTVFLIVVSGILFAHLFGLSMFRLTATKLTATSAARMTIAKMANEIRMCKTTWVGNVTNGEFAELLDGEIQKGNGLMIYPTTNTTDFILYFVNASDETFRRTTSTPGSAVILAESVTNNVAFIAQDHLGRVLTNNQNNHVIHVDLEFYQPKRHLQIADYYKLETSVTRRALE